MALLPASLRLLRSLYQVIVNNVLVAIAVSLTTAVILVAAKCFSEHIFHLHALPPIYLLLAASILLPAAAFTFFCLVNRSHNVYLVDYACFKPDSDCRVPRAKFKEYMTQFMPFFDDRSIHFLTRMIDRSGLGEETSFPPSLHYIPPSFGFSQGHAEAELILFSTIDDLFRKTCIDPSSIDVLVVNCSLFAPTPTYSDMIINRYKLRSDIRSVHLSGMGCSAGLISVGLAKNLLQITKHAAYALVVSTESMSYINYQGRKPEMHLPTVLFRMGGAAALLSNSRNKARFRLKLLLRMITSTSESAHRCVMLDEDGEGYLGMSLSKDLTAVSGEALRTSISSIAPHILPPSEKLRFVLSCIWRKVLNGKVPLYVPNFCVATEHFCIHPGGPAVIDAVQDKIHLSDSHAEPSRMTLHRFGNTSSSSLWYELAYIEAKGRMHKGDRVLMIAFGSGYKCNIAMWECILQTQCADRSWAKCIHRYPVKACSNKLTSKRHVG